jgi:hypothetical protein
MPTFSEPPSNQNYGTLTINHLELNPLATVVGKARQINRALQKDCGDKAVKND